MGTHVQTGCTPLFAHGLGSPIARGGGAGGGWGWGGGEGGGGGAAAGAEGDEAVEPPVPAKFPAPLEVSQKGLIYSYKI